MLIEEKEFLLKKLKKINKIMLELNKKNN